MLQGPPDEKTLSRAYYELAKLGAKASGAKEAWPYHPNSSEELLALAAELSRYDPRLLGILVEYFHNHWKEIRPQALRDCYPRMNTPQTVALIAEFAKRANPDHESRYFMEYLQRGLKPLPSQLYFRDLYSPGGALSKRSIDESLAEYKKWGFLGRESPTIDVFRKRSVGSLDADSRRNILRKLFESKKEIRMADYLKALPHPVTRQQALLDLKEIARLRNPTFGVGARWVLKTGKAN
jgi:hypothetical protein